MEIAWIKKSARRGGSNEPELRLTNNYLMLNRVALENVEGDYIDVGVHGGKVYIKSSNEEDGYKLSRGESSRKVQLPSLIATAIELGAKRGVYRGEWREADKVWEFSWHSPIVPRGRHVKKDGSIESDEINGATSKDVKNEAPKAEVAPKPEPKASDNSAPAKKAELNGPNLFELKDGAKEDKAGAKNKPASKRSASSKQKEAVAG